MSAFSGNVITPEAEGLVPEAVAAKAIASRTLRSLAWSPLKQDKLALAGGVIVVVLIVLAILAAPICHLLGISPIVPNPKLINPDTSLPIGNAGGMSWDHPLGIATPFGEDLLARILYGAQV
jgi:peptide/nickel transport system permease protein